MKHNELSIRERLFSKQNIYLALYSVDSYISNRELLDKEDKEALSRLKDKFDEQNIEKWIRKIEERLHQLIDDVHYLHAKIYFKPKKYDEENEKVTFRPLHSSSLLDQITAVAMLNILIYDFDADNKISMSNLSRLIPHNFYGNRVAYEPERLFKPWQEQYKQYTSKANDYYKSFHENGEYKWEVNLDLKNFFPSINPICLYNYIVQQIPVEYVEDDKNILCKILEKLIFVEIEKTNKEDLEIYLGGKKHESCKFAIGLPQGLPQSYFLANLFMVEVEKIYKNVLPGEMVFYVDDSAVFTNEIRDVEDFEHKIKTINENISAWMNDLYGQSNDFISSELHTFVAEKVDLYGINIHPPGDKSTISNIADSKKGEVYIHCIGRETSKTAFDINTSFSDEESKILLNKTECILKVVNSELEQIDMELKDGQLTDENRKYKESYKKKLVRYKKFFKYRNKDLQYREKSDTQSLQEELLHDLKFLDDNNDRQESLLEFFELYNEDTLGAAIGFVLKAMKEIGEDYSVLIEKIINLNRLLFGKDNKSSSYLYVAYKEYIEQYNSEVSEVSKYTTLKKLVKVRTSYVRKKTDNIKTNFVKKELKKIHNEYPVKDIMGQNFYSTANLVITNSCEMQRQCINAVLSSLMQIEISDDIVLQKNNNRKITYSELRILIYLRNNNFTLEDFEKAKEDFVRDEYQCAIDYSIIQVLGVFRMFVSIPAYIDNLILVHKYTCDIWKNGSKHLYFYTLHNQEHAVDLIQNSLKVIRAIDYIDISKNDYYVLFIACYLHDISMVTFPDLDSIQSGTFESDKIYSDFINSIHEELSNSNLAMRPVKKLLKEYYMRVDAFYEKIVRDSHARNSAAEIRNRHELSFIDSALREIVAEVSEAHGYNVNDIYKIKSTASSKLWSLKFTKIILRLADLLDMSNYRVSALVLNHNLDNMGETSRFHWLSHLVTTGYEIETEYYLDKDKRGNFLEKHSIVEKIILRVDVELPQLTHENPYGCKLMGLETIDKTTIKMKCGKECTSDKCNFLCKWFAQKNYYLFLELASLQEYLESLPDNYFKPEIEVVVNSSDKSRLSSKQFTLLKKYVDGR
ncbi:MAG: hypothetical protein HDR24_03940 [Lachnospiraceae bacterium]|nr:hypothetical protein [Lachnospiraceae bacterium]